MVDPHYSTLDLHVFRVAQYTLLDFPLLPEPGSQIWVATLWTDPADPANWRRTLWQLAPCGRGWAIDPLAHIGDIIEFGADTTEQVRWYGYLSGASETSLSVVGPHPTLTAADDDGRERRRAFARAVGHGAENSR